MDAEFLKQQVDAAKKATEELEEPLKSKAFEMILSRLLSSRQNTQNERTTNLDVEPDDRVEAVMRTVKSTDHPDLHRIDSALLQSLYILKIAREEAGIDGLTPTEVSLVLSKKFRMKQTIEAIKMALTRGTKYVDRESVSTTGGQGYIYKLMIPGEKYLEDQLSIDRSQPTGNKKSRITRKNNGESMTNRITSLINEDFFAAPKDAMMVKKNLGDKGHHYNDDPIRVALLSLVRKGTLRRVKDIREGKEVYLYCNP